MLYMSNQIGYIGMSSLDASIAEKSGVLIPPFTIYDTPQLALFKALARVGSDELGISLCI